MELLLNWTPVSQSSVDVVPSKSLPEILDTDPVLVVVAMIGLQSNKTSYILIYLENNSYSLPDFLDFLDAVMVTPALVDADVH